MNRPLALTVLSAGLLLAAAGCAPSSRTGSGLGTAPPTTPAAPTTPGPRTSPVSDQALPPPAETDCSLSQLQVTDRAGGSGSTHRSVVLVFRNTSSTTCHLTGYPGVAGLNGQDQQVAQATRTLSGYLGGSTSAATVTLLAGDSVSATVETLAIDATTGNSCTPYAGILVTPPNETHSIKLAWPSDGCSGLQIHPVVPGTTGSRT
jgi:hypothetical protein